MEWTTLAVAGMSLIGTLAGTFGGILVSNKLTTYRIEQLEAKVAAPTSLVEGNPQGEGARTEVQRAHQGREGKRGRLLLRHPGGEKRQQGRLTAAELRCFETRKGNAP